MIGLRQNLHGRLEALLRQTPYSAVDNILPGIERLIPIVSETRDSFDRERQLPQVLVNAMKEIGLFSLWLPREFGGLELNLGDTVSVLEEASRIDGAVGWCAGIATSNSRFAAFLPDGAARKIFLEDQAVIAGAFAPTGTATTRPGGYRVTGRWGWGSGIRHSNWLVCACVVADEEGQPQLNPDGSPTTRIMFVPTERAEIIDTWDVGGLRGTGSHDYQVTDVFVPTEHSVEGLGITPASPGSLYVIPPFTVFQVITAAVPLGIARAAIDTFLVFATTKIPRSGTTTLCEDPVVASAIGRAEAGLRAARAFLFEACAEISEIAAAAKELTLQHKALMRLATAQVATSAKEAVQIVHELGGGTSIYETAGLQRCFRDVHAAVQHVQLQSVNYKFAGRVLLGLDPGTSRF